MTKRALLRMLEREREAFAAERRNLIETICRLAGHPTTVTDRDMWLTEPDPDPVEPALVLPDHYPE